MSYDAEEMLSPQLLQDELQRVVVSRDYLWSDRFCREVSPGNMIDVRHDIAPQGARVLAQPHGVIDKEELRNTAGIRSRSLAHQNVCL